MVAPEILVPFNFHCQEGVVPPLTGVAVKVTEDPAQTGLADAAMETLTGSNGLTVITTGVEEAGLPVAQMALEVKSQEMELVFAGIKA